MSESKTVIDSHDSWFEGAPHFARPLCQHPVPAGISNRKEVSRDAEAQMSLKLLMGGVHFLQVLCSSCWCYSNFYNTSQILF